MATIGIFDSGVGGLSVLRRIRETVPGHRCVYYADNAYCPYGDKSAEFIVGRAREITELLLSKGADVIVVACNTATAAAIAALRAEYGVPFVGMEPAVKPAALGTQTGVVGVLATAGTLKSSKYLDTRGRFEDDVRIVERAGRGFVELVESFELEGRHAEQVVRAALEPLLEAGADRIVLGCTHYPFLLPVMRKVAAGVARPAFAAASPVDFIDPAPAVARRLASVLAALPAGGSDAGLPGCASPASAGPAEQPGGAPTTPASRPEAAPEPGIELLSSGPDDVLRRLYEMS